MAERPSDPGRRTGRRKSSVSVRSPASSPASGSHFRRSMTVAQGRCRCRRRPEGPARAARPRIAAGRQRLRASAGRRRRSSRCAVQSILLRRPAGRRRAAPSSDRRRGRCRLRAPSDSYVALSRLRAIFDLACTRGPSPALGQVDRRDRHPQLVRHLLAAAAPRRPSARTPARSPAELAAAPARPPRRTAAARTPAPTSRPARRPRAGSLQIELRAGVARCPGSSAGRLQEVAQLVAGDGEQPAAERAAAGS